MVSFFQHQRSSYGPLHIEENCIDLKGTCFEWGFTLPLLMAKNRPLVRWWWWSCSRTIFWWKAQGAPQIVQTPYLAKKRKTKRIIFEDSPAPHAVPVLDRTLQKPRKYQYRIFSNEDDIRMYGLVESSLPTKINSQTLLYEGEEDFGCIEGGFFTSTDWLKTPWIVECRYPFWQRIIYPSITSHHPDKIDLFSVNPTAPSFMIRWFVTSMPSSSNHHCNSILETSSKTRCLCFFLHSKKNVERKSYLSTWRIPWDKIDRFWFHILSMAFCQCISWWRNHCGWLVYCKNSWLLCNFGKHPLGRQKPNTEWCCEDVFWMNSDTIDWVDIATHSGEFHKFIPPIWKKTPFCLFGRTLVTRSFTARTSRYHFTVRFGEGCSKVLFDWRPNTCWWIYCHTQRNGAGDSDEEMSGHWHNLWMKISGWIAIVDGTGWGRSHRQMPFWCPHSTNIWWVSCWWRFLSLKMMGVFSESPSRRERKKPLNPFWLSKVWK